VDKHTDEDDQHNHALIDQFNQDELMDAGHMIMHQRMNGHDEGINHQEYLFAQPDDEDENSAPHHKGQGEPVLS
jgi:hypothetical protein